MQLDDWVLCRIRQKGNMSKNAKEIEKNPSNVPDYLPMINEIPSVCTDVGPDKILDYFSSSDYHRVASLLVGNELTTEFNPKIPLQSNNNAKGNTDEAPNSWFQSLFNSSSGQTNEENKDTGTFEGHHQSEGDKCKINSSNVMTNCLEIYMPPLSETNFLQ